MAMSLTRSKPHSGLMTPADASAIQDPREVDRLYRYWRVRVMRVRDRSTNTARNTYPGIPVG